ncbi:hypothetical protein [Nocardia concava]|uniref:hypothetical protein n=1 Tax=Nocardia concava TaxID=257281 RepID=UPI0012FBB300|nr:hypothetical protein [Nocardia concava]
MVVADNAVLASLQQPLDSGVTAVQDCSILFAFFWIAPAVYLTSPIFLSCATASLIFSCAVAMCSVPVRATLGAVPWIELAARRDTA